MIDPFLWYLDCRIDGGNDEEETLAGGKEPYMKCLIQENFQVYKYQVLITRLWIAYQ
jgi:hypothetical protein